MKRKARDKAPYPSSGRPQSSQPVRSTLHSALPAAEPLRILVAGEVILDRYLWGDVSRISPEAPIPILRVHRREARPGNSGFVMANLRAFGARVSALGVVGADRNGNHLRDILRGAGVDVRALMSDSGRATIVKERMLGSVQSANRATQQLLRVDEEDPSPPTAAIERMLIGRVPAAIKRASGVLVSDINKGLLTPKLLRALISHARRRKIPIVIDPRLCEDFSIYRGATVLTPNRYETELATGMRLTDRHEWRRAAEMLVEKLDLKACLITLDRDGMYLAERGGADTYIPTTPREVYDVTGAGDVVLATFGLFVTAGLSYASAASLANLAAGLEVSRMGAEVVTRDELARVLSPARDGYQHKIVSHEELAAALDRHRQSGHRIAFTNGCFDLLHAGHVELLNFARTHGDVLVVGLNSDRSVKALKGSGRPLYSAAERSRILAALEAVSYVVVFDDTRAERIIRAVRPDVLIKGEDWRGQRLDGADFVESHGGRVLLAPLLAGHSTTRTLSRMLEASRNGSAQ